MRKNRSVGNRVRLLQAFVILLTFVGMCSGQTSAKPEPPVLIRSWATGAPIRESVFSITLDSAKESPVEYVGTYGYRRYKLSFRFGKADARSSWDRDKWQVVLQEVLSKPSEKKEKLGCNLLMVEGCGIGHHFPIEDNAATLFPTYESKDALVRMMLQRYYPIALQRTFWVQNFFVKLNVIGLKMNEKDPTKLDSLDVSVSFEGMHKEFR